MVEIRVYAGLRPRAGDGLDAERMEGHRRERDRLLLAYGEQHVHLALVRHGIERFGTRNEVVGHSASGGHDYYNFVPPVHESLYPLRDVENFVCVADGRAAVFLNDQ